MSLPKPTAKIWIDCDKKKVMLSAPFNSYFNQLVRFMPRFFNKETKIWSFDIEYADEVADIAFKCWPNVIKPPFLLMEIFEYLTEDDLKDMYASLSKRHRNDGDKTLLTLINKFFVDYIDLTEVVRKRRLIRLEITTNPDIDTEINSLFFGRDLEPIEQVGAGTSGHSAYSGYSGQQESVIGSLVDVVLPRDMRDMREDD